MDPPFAIGERALLVPAGDRFVMWDCLPLVDDDTAGEIERRGGLAAIAISHPHYYTGMADWAHRFDCPVLLHADDRRWITRPDDAIELWEGETRDLGHGLTLIRCGGHFAGGTVLHDANRGRAAVRRHRAGDPRPRVGRLHVQLPEPDPAAGGVRAGDRARAGAVRVRHDLRRLVGQR